MLFDSLSWLALAAACSWIALLLVPWRPWSTSEHLVVTSPTGPADLSEVTVLIPARDEASHIAATVAAVRAQGVGHRIIVIDDQSRDGTAEAARHAGAEVIAGQPLAAGWTGKLWALEQGRRQVVSPLILQLDADIELRPGVISALIKRQAAGYGMVSVMAMLPAVATIQKLLLPAYVWFFMLLYPFRLANGPSPRFAAAAGGCLLIQSRVLAKLGGYEAIRGRVIDDCALAAAVKRRGARTWIGLSRDVISRRNCQGVPQVRDLVARTAFTQLGHSTALLLVLTAVMLVLFWLPLVLLYFAPAASWTAFPWSALVGATAWLAMVMAYAPLLAFYGLSSLWGLTLPIIAALYLWMTWVSAWRHWRGRGAQWKGRTYGTDATNDA